jgi:predicted translin family RNA/ssDNA-binding protein
MEPDVAGVLSQFKSIKRQAIQVQQSIRDYLKHRTPGYRSFFDSGVLNSLIKEFKDAKIHFDMIRHKQNFGLYLRNIEMSRGANEIAISREIEVECDKAIGVLESIATPLSKDEIDKLTALREELEKLSEVLPDINYGRNLEEAIDEYEKGDFLASALISSRVIIYAVDQIPGKSDEEKVKFLHEKGIIEKGRKDVHESIIKASRRARNFFSHDIKVFPRPSEAHSLLGDAIGILGIVSKVLRKEEEKEF